MPAVRVLSRTSVGRAFAPRLALHGVPVEVAAEREMGKQSFITARELSKCACLQSDSTLAGDFQQVSLQNNPQRGTEPREKTLGPTKSPSLVAMGVRLPSGCPSGPKKEEKPTHKGRFCSLVQGVAHRFLFLLFVLANEQVKCAPSRFSKSVAKGS